MYVELDRIKKSRAISNRLIILKWIEIKWCDVIQSKKIMKNLSTAGFMVG